MRRILAVDSTVVDKVFSVAVIKFVAQVLVSPESFTLFHSHTSNMHVKLSVCMPI